MKRNAAFSERDCLAIRAGGISVLVLALCFLALTGLSSLPRVWLFLCMFAVCFVLMVKSLVDLGVCLISLAARGAGAGLGHSLRLSRPFLVRGTLRRQA
jgi:hypothetical protein